ncbi:dihydrofolate reductase family protein [Spirilliplanes yamanashiensis]|uniref:Deaminase n=1 Tax=Spirilliplanes yamanashiensis TaxID=42233 RepID=A0A8J3Y6F3_9ACTN|nr:dihydrofolate reductase family protein [Spirilliplanes yamanashiensis]MDP9814555.1 dihydrofolate reductase [Spirilliplanes yamanashiensis]GIJ02207.1 deaminase [Spirilliplanes yamanashiensis]
MLLWHATMSLDGFIAGPGHRMEGVFRHAGPNPEADAVLRTTGAILAGRNAFEAAVAGGAALFGEPGRVPVFVLTNRPLDDAPPGVTTLHGDIHEAVAAAQEAAGGRDVLVFGAEAARECLDAGLLDEVLVHVAPVLLGDGVRLVGRPGVGQVELEPLSVTRAGAVTNLRFRVIGPLP